ncbi:MAG: hypothetical protein K2X82_20475, partial [Gemmataceae bacterium]|nr:hypothetical protein [Gemmataceae bacterium]
MGVVYRATNTAVGREVAVKVLQDRYGPAVRRRGPGDGPAPAPRRPPVYDRGVLPDGRPFLAMKLVKGRTLEAILASGGRVRPEADGQPGAAAPRAGTR